MITNLKLYSKPNKSVIDFLDKFKNIFVFDYIRPIIKHMKKESKKKNKN